MSNEKKLGKGFGIIEIVIATTIISVAFLTMMSTASMSLRTSEKNTLELKANFLLEESVEAVKIMRDNDWQTNIASLSAGTDYFLEFDGATWLANVSNVLIDGVFERKFIINDVYRDANDDISSSGVLDQNTKKITVYVSWSKNGSIVSKSISFYISNIFN